MLYPNVRNFFSGLLGRSPPKVQQEEPSAPPLSLPTHNHGEGSSSTSVTSSNSLPYMRCDTKDRMTTWRRENNFSYLEKGDENGATGRDLRCAVCFNAMSSGDEVVCYQDKVGHST